MPTPRTRGPVTAPATRSVSTITAPRITGGVSETTFIPVPTLPPINKREAQPPLGLLATPALLEPLLLLSWIFSFAALSIANACCPRPPPPVRFSTNMRGHAQPVQTKSCTASILGTGGGWNPSKESGGLTEAAKRKSREPHNRSSFGRN